LSKEYELVSAYFKDENLGYLFSNDGKIFETTDGGKTWIYHRSSLKREMQVIVNKGGNFRALTNKQQIQEILKLEWLYK
jgi:photosystem II stability/assembly factor-like uncharacterized protein